MASETNSIFHAPAREESYENTLENWVEEFVATIFWTEDNSPFLKKTASKLGYNDQAIQEALTQPVNVYREKHSPVYEYLLDKMGKASRDTRWVQLRSKPNKKDKANQLQNSLRFKRISPKINAIPKDSSTIVFPLCESCDDYGFFTKGRNSARIDQISQKVTSIQKSNFKNVIDSVIGMGKQIILINASFSNTANQSSKARENPNIMTKLEWAKHIAKVMDIDLNMDHIDTLTFEEKYKEILSLIYAKKPGLILMDWRDLLQHPQLKDQSKQMIQLYRSELNQFNELIANNENLNINFNLQLQLLKQKEVTPELKNKILTQLKKIKTLEEFQKMENKVDIYQGSIYHRIDEAIAKQCGLDNADLMDLLDNTDTLLLFLNDEILTKSSDNEKRTPNNTLNYNLFKHANITIITEVEKRNKNKALITEYLQLPNTMIKTYNYSLKNGSLLPFSNESDHNFTVYAIKEIKDSNSKTTLSRINALSGDLSAFLASSYKFLELQLAHNKGNTALELLLTQHDTSFENGLLTQDGTPAPVEEQKTTVIDVFQKALGGRVTKKDSKRHTTLTIFFDDEQECSQKKEEPLRQNHRSLSTDDGPLSPLLKAGGATFTFTS